MLSRRGKNSLEDGGGLASEMSRCCVAKASPSTRSSLLRAYEFVLFYRFATTVLIFLISDDVFVQCLDRRTFGRRRRCRAAVRRRSSRSVRAVSCVIVICSHVISRDAVRQAPSEHEKLPSSEHH